MGSQSDNRWREGLIDLTTESEQVQIAALKAKIQTLNSQLNQVWAEATNFDKRNSNHFRIGTEKGG